MLRKIISCCLSFLFLTGSTLLPLCDFSLMADIPKMYHSYEKLVAPDEAGIVDFIGDYVLAGKALLGHNKSDKPEKPGTSVQFQHPATGFIFLHSKLELTCFFIRDLKTNHAPVNDPIRATAFYSELFRPPLV